MRMYGRDGTTICARSMLLHGEVLVQSDTDDPFVATYAISSSIAHLPLAQTPLPQSACATHATHAPFGAQIGASVGQSFMPARHCTQPPATQNRSASVCPNPGHC